MTLTFAWIFDAELKDAPGERGVFVCCGNEETIQAESLQMLAMMRNCSSALLISQRLENFFCCSEVLSSVLLQIISLSLMWILQQLIDEGSYNAARWIIAYAKLFSETFSARGTLKANFKFITFIKSHQEEKRHDGEVEKLCVKLPLLSLSRPASSRIHIMFLGCLLVLKTGNPRGESCRSVLSLTLLKQFVCKTKLIFISIINSIFYFIYGFDRALASKRLLSLSLTPEYLHTERRRREGETSHMRDNFHSKDA